MIVAIKLVAAYLVVAGFFAAKRAIKISDLHDEFKLVRAREHKSHIRMYAVSLFAGFKGDMMWPLEISKRVKAAIGWIKEQ